MLTGFVDFRSYQPDCFFDELYEGVGVPRKPAEAMIQCLDALASEELLVASIKQNWR